MNLTIQDVRKIITNSSIGSSAKYHIAALLKKLEITEEVETLAVDQNGRLLINEKFWNKYAKDNTQVAAFLLWHEFMHLLLGDTEKFTDPEVLLNKDLYNFAADMRINAIIYLMSKSNPTSFGITNPGQIDKFLKSLYGKGFSGLLRPNYTPRKVGYSITRLYRTLWNSGNGGYYSRFSVKAIANEIASISPMAKVYIGGHGKIKNETGQGNNPMQQQAIEGLGQTIAKTLNNTAGISHWLKSSLISVITGGKGLHRKFCKTFAVKDELAKMRMRLFPKKKKIPSVVPIKPRNRDMVMLAAGVIPKLLFSSSRFSG